MTTIEEAINHYKYGITHDIFSEPVTTYAALSITALEKRIPQKPDLYHRTGLPDHGRGKRAAGRAAFCPG
jgi:hypothetical protein